MRAALADSATQGTDVVLVIDDSDVARAEMMRVLTQAGFRVMGLASPIGATRTILDNAVRVVVIDIMMPGMRGDRLAALFRGNPRLRELGVVLVTGASASELLSLSVESGANAVVSKAHLHELVPAVHKALRRRDSVPGITYG
jgi:PleD family two-component response regulator